MANGVTKDQYYQERIQDIRENNSAFNGLQLQLCALGERVAVNETANAYQNRITDIGFSNQDIRFGTERLITDYEIQAATCNVIRGNTMLRPEQIGDPYHGVRLGMGYPQPFCGAPAPSNPFVGGYDGECGCR